MSLKRQAMNELTHENWNQEDATEKEDMGSFKTAPIDVLEKRVMRTAKRRSQISSDEPRKSVFSGFGGFNKIQQSSFDFLANLTNGTKANNNTPTTKNDTTVSSSIFTNKLIPNSPSTGIFSMSGSSGFGTKSILGKPNEGSLFSGSATSNTSSMQSVFTATKADSTVNDSPFKLQASAATDSVSKPNTNPDTSTSQVSSSIFGAPTNSSSSKSLFTSTTNTTTFFSTQAVSSTSTSPLNSTTISKSDSNTTECSSKYNEKEEKKSNSDQKEEKKRTYFSKLKGLNESVSDWIKKHVQESPICILSPIFKDYDRYVKEIQEEYNGGEESVEQNDNNSTSKASPETKTTPASTNMNSSVFGSITSINSTKLNVPQSSKNDITTKSSLNFGINTSTTTTTTASTGFSSGITVFSTFTPNTGSGLFSGKTSATTNANTLFPIGINKSRFGFNATSPKSQTSEATKEDDDEPPKVEYTPVIEENSIFDIKCKVFIKKDGNFVDKGVGTLHIKKIEESGKHQLLVRANTNLGSVLLNLVLSSSIPMQRMGKNNVMMVCIPVPDANPPPTPILIRVKTAEEADELLSTLNKYKA